jgi:hypothetical protein
MQSFPEPEIYSAKENVYRGTKEKTYIYVLIVFCATILKLLPLIPGGGGLREI